MPYEEVWRRRWRALHIFAHMRFLEVTYSFVTWYELLRAESALASAHNQPVLLGMHNWNQHLLSKCTKLELKWIFLVWTTWFLVLNMIIYSQNKSNKFRTVQKQSTNRNQEDQKMLTEERHSIITDTVNTRKSVTIAELCRILDVSASTVKRDLNILAEAGKITKAVSYTHLTLPTTPYV